MLTKRLDDRYQEAESLERDLAKREYTENWTAEKASMWWETEERTTK